MTDPQSLSERLRSIPKSLNQRLRTYGEGAPLDIYANIFREAADALDAKDALLAQAERALERIVDLLDSDELCENIARKAFATIREAKP